MEAYREGATLRQVADRYGVSSSHVYRTVRRVAPGIMRAPGSPRPLAPNEKDRDFVEAYSAGATLDEVAERYGVSWRTVYRRIRKVAPWIMRERGPPPTAEPNERDRRIMENRRAGMTLAAIGELEGITPSRVHAVLKHWRYEE